MPVRALNLYYARDESTRAQVLGTRLRATDVRASIGIGRGRVFTRVDAEGDLPDVMWDCPFADARAHDDDMRARAASVEFERCRATMRTLTRRFERVLYQQAVVSREPDIGPAEEILQIWIVGSRASRPDFASLHPLPAATVLHRADDNARLPDWIVEVRAADRDAHSDAIERWLEHHSPKEATMLRWRRAA